MPFVDRVLLLTTENAQREVVERLADERFTRILIGGRPMIPAVERLAKAAVDRGLDTMLLTDLSAGEPSPNGEVLRAVLRLRKAGADPTNCGQASTIIGTHRLKTALVLVNVDANDPGSLPSEETARDLRLLLSKCRT